MERSYPYSIRFREHKVYQSIKSEAAKEDTFIGDYIEKIHRIYVESKEETSEKGR